MLPSNSFFSGLIRVIIAFVIVNSAFVLVHLIGDKATPVELAKERIQLAIETGAIDSANYIHKAYPKGSPKLSIGIDHFTDCETNLFLLYRDPQSAIKNAVVPGHHAVQDQNEMCNELHNIAFDNVDPAKLILVTKARLWHGAKAFIQFMLPVFEYYQLYEIIRQLSHIGLALLLAYSFSHSRQAGLAFIPVTVVGMMGSGLTVYGGITNALPYTVALLLALSVTIAHDKLPTRWSMIVATLAGSIMAFVYVLDGSLILVSSMLVFLLYFTSSTSNRLTRWRYVIFYGGLFMASFFLSFVFKQLVSGLVISPDLVWKDFTDTVLHRTGTMYNSVNQSHWEAFYGQILNYYPATTWNMPLKDIFIYSGYLGWIVAIFTTIATMIRSRHFVILSDFAAFALIALIVFLRYAVMVNHSFEHWFIVSRYVFVFLAFGVAAAIWTIYTFRATQQSVPENEPNLS